MIRLLYITRFKALAVLLLMLVALASARAQNVVYVGQTDTLSVQQNPGDVYTWELYKDSTVNFAVTPGDVSPTYADFVGGNTGSSVSVKWKEVGIYFFKVTAMNASGCTSNLRVGKMKVIHSLPKAKITTTPICEGDPVKLKVDLTGVEPWSFTITDGTKTWSFSDVMDTTYEAIINPGPKTPTSYWVTVVDDKWGTNTKPTKPELQVVNPKPATSPIYLYEP